MSRPAIWIAVSVFLILAYVVTTPHVGTIWHAIQYKSGKSTVMRVTFHSETACWNEVDSANKDATTASYSCRPSYTLLWGW
jgi:hypothetical protein